MINRPKDEEELQKREVVGVFQASRFLREYAKSHRAISTETICQIHAEIFKEVWPEIAGVYRNENLVITGSDHVPPHWSQVPGCMGEVEGRMREYATNLKGVEGLVLERKDLTKEHLSSIQEVFNFAAYVHHAITFVHPFREGNGRTARLATNLILERYGFVGISIRIERENKNRYCNALAQIDKHQDYEPLLDLIAEGVIDRYRGVPMKFMR